MLAFALAIDAIPMGEMMESAEPKKKMGCLKISLIIVAVLAGLIVLGSIVGPSPSTSDAAKPEAAADAAAAPAVEVTAKELFSAYESNEAAAQQKYGDKPLKVTGTIDKIDLDFMDKPVVMLRTQNEFMSAQASLTEESQPKASGLSKGQNVTLLCGGVSEVIGTPMLKDCAIQ